MYALRGIVVNTRTHKYLIYYLLPKSECTPMKHTKCMGKTRVLMQTKNARVQFVCTHAVCPNHDAHGSRPRVYLTCIFTSSIFRAHAGYFVCIFRKVLSHVVASRMCSQV